MSEKCRPHRWRTPKPEDSHLTCDECGRMLELWELESWPVRVGVLKAYAKRCGNEAAKVFAGKLADALNHRRREIANRKRPQSLSEQVEQAYLDQHLEGLGFIWEE